MTLWLESCTGMQYGNLAPLKPRAEPCAHSLGHAPEQLLHVARDVAPGHRQAAQRAAQHVAVHDRHAAGAAVARVHHRARQCAPVFLSGQGIRVC